MKTLFKFNINWNIFILLSVLIRLIFLDLSIFSFLAVVVSLYQFLLLLHSLGKIIPIRFLLGSFMCLQLLLGPVLAYNGLDNYQTGFYKMQIPEQEYFMYVLPAVVMFILGLHFKAGFFDGETVDIESVEKYVKGHPKLPFLLIIVGFCSSIFGSFFSNDFAFVFFLVGGFKFIGVFLLMFSDYKLKPIYLIVVYASIIASSIMNAMFHDLLIWLIFLGTIFAIRYKPSGLFKTTIVIAFVLFAVFIQIIKPDYRKSTWKQGEEAGVETLEKTISQRQEKTGFFDFNQLAQSNLRINQGAIITNIMRNVPEHIPFSNGTELMQVLEASILPRIVAPDKLNAGDRDFFMKWSGMVISSNTSMGLSSVGDAYVNFGIIGGCIFMFFYGLLFNTTLKQFNKYKKEFPLLILFICLVFYYPIRPDCELHTILGHLFKSCFLIFVMFKIWKHDLMVKFSAN